MLKIFFDRLTFFIIVNLMRFRVSKGFPVEEISDGYHTFEELYDFRLVYNALLFNEWAKSGKYNVHKSIRHSDGKPCFGDKFNWFIVVANLPEGQISNHYPVSYWNWFEIPDFPKAKFEYDFHTSRDVFHRLEGLVKKYNSSNHQGGGFYDY